MLFLSNSQFYASDAVRHKIADFVFRQTSMKKVLQNFHSEQGKSRPVNVLN